jgi:hypothetical protein
MLMTTLIHHNRFCSAGDTAAASRFPAISNQSTRHTQAKCHLLFPISQSAIPACGSAGMLQPLLSCHASSCNVKNPTATAAVAQAAQGVSQSLTVQKVLLLF